MKKLKKITVFVLTITLILFSMCFAQAIDEEELEFRLTVSMQEKALDAYQLLWDSFEKDENCQPIYPDEYGGEYIEDDKLVIQLTENTTENQQKYRELCGNSDKVVFEEVEYSLNYLNSLDSEAKKLYEKYKVTSVGVDRKNNRYFIHVEKEDLDKVIAEYSRSRSSSPIIFEEGAPIESMSKAIIGGDRVDDQWGGYSTITASGIYNGKTAFLTCGHGYYSRETLRYDGVDIGEISVHQHANNDYGDYSIVTVTNPNYVKSLKVRGVSGSYYQLSGTASAPAGTAIRKYGRATGYTTGYVGVVNISATDSYGKLIKGLSTCRLNIKPMAGDSGGPIYTSSKLVGVLKGVETVQNVVTVYYTQMIYPQRDGFSF